MFPRQKFTRGKSKPQGEGKVLVPVRSGSFYGLNFEQNNVETSTIKRGIVATPTFIFNDDYTKIKIDFSDYKNVVSEDLINEFFKLTLDGVTMTIENAKWKNNTLSSRKVDLSGTYTFTEFTNKVVFGNVVTLNNYDSNVKRYDKSNFITTPNIVLDFSSTQEEKNTTKVSNEFGPNSKNSFKYLGAKSGDYIAFTNVDKKYEIISISTDEENKEIVVINGKITNENRKDLLTDVFLFSVNYDETIVENFSSTLIGKCDVNRNSTFTCFDNQSELQCQLNKNSKLSETSTFTQNTFCSTPVSSVNRMTESERLLEIVKTQTLNNFRI
jgi:hypothetical protein